MELDHKYLKKLSKPLKGQVGLRPSQYFKALDDIGVLVTDNNNIVDEKFLFHFQYLIKSGAIENGEGTNNLKDYGVTLGADNYMALCDSAILRLRVKTKKQNAAVKWILDNIIAVIISGLILAALLTWLGLSTP